MLSSTNNNNSIKKNIEKKKSYATTLGLNPNVGNNQVVPEKEKICSGPIHVPLGKGTVLVCAQILLLSNVMKRQILCVFKCKVMWNLTLH